MNRFWHDPDWCGDKKPQVGLQRYLRPAQPRRDIPVIDPERHSGWRLPHARGNAFDKHSGDRTQCAIFQGDDRDWPRACGPFYRQRLEKEAFLVESQDRIGKSGYVPTRGQEVGAKVKRKRHNAHLWDRQSAGTECLLEEKTIPGVRVWADLWEE